MPPRPFCSGERANNFETLLTASPKLVFTMLAAGDGGSYTVVQDIWKASDWGKDVLYCSYYCLALRWFLFSSLCHHEKARALPQSPNVSHLKEIRAKRLQSEVFTHPQENCLLRIMSLNSHKHVQACVLMKEKSVNLFNDKKRAFPTQNQFVHVE